MYRRHARSPSKSPLIRMAPTYPPHPSLPTNPLVNYGLYCKSPLAAPRGHGDLVLYVCGPGGMSFW